jgi:Zn-dependent protease
VTLTRPPAGAPMDAPAGPPARQPGDSGLAGSSAAPRRQDGFRIAGVAVNFTPGAALLGVLAAGFGALALPELDPGRSVPGYLAAAAGLVIVLLGSMAAHELAHSIMARRYGRQVPATVGFFGGLRHGRAPRPGSVSELEWPSPRAQRRVAAAGPLASLLLSMLAAAAAVILSALGAGLLPVAVAVAAANLVPGAGLDGGRIVRALAWARSGDPTRAGLIAARFGQVSGSILTAAGVTALAFGHLAGLWFGLVGLLTAGASRAEVSQVRTPAGLAGVRVRDILLPDGGLAPTARGWQMVGAFLQNEGSEGLAPAAAIAYPVRDFDGQLSGLVTLAQLRSVPAGHRDVTRLSQVATPVACLAFTTLDEPLTDLRARLARGDGRPPPASPAALHTAGYALVLGPSGELAGLLTPADFARAAQAGGLRFTTAGAGPGSR